ncbi:PAS domain-containing protein [Pseudomonas sp. MSSRFD41]|uniref:PAS domain-containing protein n=1 Tax=Pseudomonas sp. MSSRFD41 TaxID=1310370 RepID=UPI0016397DE8|nr:PAS domain-containing protein [Pseudomonas sp. MSSRFD41]MBC2658811.1 PAS domain-containing protein [Pseudomonas sp. MSSRFD41]
MESTVVDIQRAMLDATPDCIKVLTPDGLLLAMSEAGCAAFQIPRAQVKGTAWIPLLPASTHGAALDALALAGRGICARFTGYSDAHGKIIHWDNLLTPTLDLQGQVHNIICVSRDVTEQVLLQRELNQALARERLLTGERLHRIKNLFTVADAVVMMADREARSTGVLDRLGKIAAEKLRALSRVYTQVLDAEDAKTIEMTAFIGAVLQPFGGQCRFGGTFEHVPGVLANLLALLLHELATNSVKHGALSVVEGEVDIRWASHEGWLRLDWHEQGGPVILAPPARDGYGCELINELAVVAGGTIERDWRPDGLRVVLKLSVAGK